jgi:hypothetical protein
VHNDLKAKRGNLYSEIAEKELMDETKLTLFRSNSNAELLYLTVYLRVITARE